MRIGHNDLSISNRWMQWVLVLALAAMALAAAGINPAAAADNGTNKDALKDFCEEHWGIWYERGDGSYGCMVNGLETSCDSNGNCTSICHERWGCPCDEVPIPCKRAGKPGTSDNPWGHTVPIDYYQEAKLPDRSGSEPSSPEPVIDADDSVLDDDQVMKGAS